MEKREVRIGAKNELDARAIAEAVQVANRFESALHIETEDTNVNVKSIMGMMTLHLTKGDGITLVADGPDESEALAALQLFFTGA